MEPWIRRERAKRQPSHRELMDEFVWGVATQLRPDSSVITGPPDHPDALRWFRDGQEMARQGYVRLARESAGKVTVS